MAQTWKESRGRPVGQKENNAPYPTGPIVAFCCLHQGPKGVKKSTMPRHSSNFFCSRMRPVEPLWKFANLGPAYAQPSELRV